MDALCRIVENWLYFQTTCTVSRIDRKKVYIYIHIPGVTAPARHTSHTTTLIFPSLMTGEAKASISHKRVNCPCPEQGRNSNSQLSCNICSNVTNRTWRSWPNHSQGSCEWVDCDLEVLWVELKQILHLKVGCSDFGPVRDRGSLPYVYDVQLPCDASVFIKFKYATSLTHKFCWYCVYLRWWFQK